ncbi:hypothetical protein HELRODRAFT_122541, partial [Helobdella robusta]|uniref:Inward rectifier potassium channel C-terminal domain-containing protein n=1 Tax=Helobdella robusta TaxID=6412 RepID=T1EGU9_HELRO
RLVEKSGESNITLVNVTKRRRKFIIDFMTTIMELKWRYHVLFFFVSFVLSWVLFGFAWYLVAWINNDLDPKKTDLCVINVRDFPSAFMFSIETQATIGYGYRYINSNCGFGAFLIMLQSCFGIFITCFTTGIFFGKISRPKRRSQTIMFSKNAVICKLDGGYSLQFRVGDMRKAHIIGTSIRAILVRQKKTEENGIIPLCQFPLEIETETSKQDSFLFFMWPVTISHKINESSPFWKMSAEDVLLNPFEVVIILEGTVPTNGALIQVRTSYLSSEICWGQKLTPLITVETFKGDCVIDYSKFHETTPITMLECSAAEHKARKQM